MNISIKFNFLLLFLISQFRDTKIILNENIKNLKLQLQSISKYKIKKYVTSHKGGGSLIKITPCDKGRNGLKVLKFVLRSLWMIPNITHKRQYTMTTERRTI